MNRLRRALLVGSRFLITRGTPMQRAITGAFVDLLLGSQQYAAADANRLLADWWMTKQTSDDELRWSVDRLRRRARDLERNNAAVRSWLRHLAVNVIGPDGILLEAQVRDNSGELNAALNTRIEQAWQEWTADPLIGGRQDFNSFQRTLIRSRSRDGEIIIRKWRGYPGNKYAFALEAVDPDLLDETLNQPGKDGENAIRLGVEVDSYSRPVAYHLWNRPASLTGIGMPRFRVRVPADQILHLFVTERQNQTRGVTEMASIMVGAKMLDGYVESEMVASRIAAAKMGFFTRKRDEAGGLLPADEKGEFQMEASPGTFGVLPDGYELTTFDPNHPNSNYGAFIKDSLRRMASALGIAYNTLASDLENVNYSSMREGRLTEQDYWRMEQNWWIASFLKPIYAEWMNSALLSGALKLDSRVASKFLAADWTPRGYPWVDPLKETQAGVLAVQSGMASRKLLLAQQGLSVERVFEQLAEEEELAAEYGIEIAGPTSVVAPKTIDTPEQPSGTATPAAEAAAEQDTTDAQGRARRVSRIARFLKRDKAHTNGGSR